MAQPAEPHQDAGRPQGKSQQSIIRNVHASEAEQTKKHSHGQLTPFRSMGGESQVDVGKISMSLDRGISDEEDARVVVRYDPKKSNEALAHLVGGNLLRQESFKRGSGSADCSVILDELRKSRFDRRCGHELLQQQDPAPF